MINMHKCPAVLWRWIMFRFFCNLFKIFNFFTYTQRRGRWAGWRQSATGSPMTRLARFNMLHQWELEAPTHFWKVPLERAVVTHTGHLETVPTKALQGLQAAWQLKLQPFLIGSMFICSGWLYRPRNCITWAPNSASTHLIHLPLSFYVILSSFNRLVSFSVYFPVFLSHYLRSICQFLYPPIPTWTELKHAIKHVILLTQPHTTSKEIPLPIHLCICLRSS